MSLSDRAINLRGAFTAETERQPSLEPLGDWQDARVAFVTNSEGTVYLAVVTRDGATYYPLTPRCQPGDAAL